MNSEESKALRDLLAEIHEEILLVDGYDDCIICVAYRIGMEPIVAYDKNMMLEKMVSEDEMTIEDAVEHFEYNIIGAYMGEYTPIFIDRDILDHVQYMMSNWGTTKP